MPHAQVPQKPQRAEGGGTMSVVLSDNCSLRAASDTGDPSARGTSMLGDPLLTKGSNRHGFSLVWHDHLGGVTLHGGEELAGVGLDDRERAVVARDHRVELEEALDRERRGGGAHGETIADRH